MSSLLLVSPNNVAQVQLWGEGAAATNYTLDAYLS